MKPLTSDEVRANLDQAIEQLGGATRAGALCNVSATTIFMWKKRGNLNKTPAIFAIRLAKAAKRPIQDFILMENGR